MAEEAIEGGAENARQEAIIDNLPPLQALDGVEREVMEYRSEEHTSELQSP